MPIKRLNVGQRTQLLFALLFDLYCIRRRQTRQHGTFQIHPVSTDVVSNVSHSTRVALFYSFCLQ